MVATKYGTKFRYGKKRRGVKPHGKNAFSAGVSFTAVAEPVPEAPTGSGVAAHPSASQTQTVSQVSSSFY